MTLNNQLSLFANYTYTMDWSYKWDVENGEFKTFDEYAEARKEAGGGKDFKKAKSKDVGAGAEYNITNKMKAGGEFGWAQSANDIPFDGDIDSEDAKLDYNIKINLWVEWTF